MASLCKEAAMGPVRSLLSKDIERIQEQDVSCLAYNSEQQHEFTQYLLPCMPTKFSLSLHSRRSQLETRPLAV